MSQFSHDRLLEDLIHLGDLHMISHMVENYGDKLTQKIKCVNLASRYGRLDIVKCLHKRGFPLDAGAMYNAVYESHLKVIEYLIEEKCTYDVDDVSSKIGDIETLKLLHKKGFLLTEKIFMSVYRRELEDCIIYLLDNNCPIPRNMSLGTRGLSHSTIVKLHQKGMLVDEYTMLSSIENSALETVKYLHENGCPWNAECFSRAAKGKDLSIVKYLHENECSINHLFRYKFSNSDIEKYCHDNDIFEFWNCNSGHCKLCYEQRQDICRALWHMEDENYDNAIQWLPENLLDDVIEQLKFPKESLFARNYAHTSIYNWSMDNIHIRDTSIGHRVENEAYIQFI